MEAEGEKAASILTRRDGATDCDSLQRGAHLDCVLHTRAPNRSRGSTISCCRWSIVRKNNNIFGFDMRLVKR